MNEGQRRVRERLQDEGATGTTCGTYSYEATTMRTAPKEKEMQSKEMHAICNSFRRQESDEIATIANAQQAKRMIQLTQPLSISADLRKIHTHTHTETGTIAQQRTHTREKDEGIKDRKNKN